MNYRQFKKNYKKKHGYNPPLKDDKRKQYKVIRKSLKQLKQILFVDFDNICQKVINGIADYFKILEKAFTNVGNNLEVNRMSKAVLSLDMPTGCIKCPLYDYVPSRCFITDKFQNNISEDFKPDWCPLIASKSICKKLNNKIE